MQAPYYSIILCCHGKRSNKGPPLWRLYSFSHFRQVVQSEQVASIYKVFEQVLHEFLYADDCALEAHSQQDIQLISDKFSEAARKYGLAINTKKTEVMFQPAPGNTYLAPNVSVDGVALKPVTEFCYLGSMLADDALIDKDVENRSSRASTSFDRLNSKQGMESIIVEWFRAVFAEYRYTADKSTKFGR